MPAARLNLLITLLVFNIVYKCKKSPAIISEKKQEIIFSKKVE